MYITFAYESFPYVQHNFIFHADITNDALGSFLKDVFLEVIQIKGTNIKNFLRK